VDDVSAFGAVQDLFDVVAWKRCLEFRKQVHLCLIAELFAGLLLQLAAQVLDFPAQLIVFPSIPCPFLFPVVLKAFKL
jgi:hypothetical protein